jgi:hypothetical protein
MIKYLTRLAFAIMLVVSVIAPTEAGTLALSSYSVTLRRGYFKTPWPRSQKFSTDWPLDPYWRVRKNSLLAYTFLSPSSNYAKFLLKKH